MNIQGKERGGQNTRGSNKKKWSKTKKLESCAGKEKRPKD